MSAQAVVKSPSDTYTNAEPFKINSPGTIYGKTAIEAYAHKRPPDLSYFLDQHIFKSLNNVENKKIIDVGCGAAPHAIYAAQRGAIVEALDTQPKMIEEALSAIRQAGLSDRIKACITTGNLPYNKPQFDHALSINVGCNLPKNIFQEHFAQISSVLFENATATIAAPYSLDVVFTDKSIESQDAIIQIQAALDALPDNPEPFIIREILNSFTQVLSATFAVCDNRLILVTPSSKLLKGHPIYRKLPNCVIPNYYHSDLEYQQAMNKAGFKIIDIERHRLSQGKENSEIYHFGSAYETNAPFVIYHLQKI